MLKIIAHDTINDIALIRTNFGFAVRYGLEVTDAADCHSALKKFKECQRHALTYEGHFG